MAKCFWTALLVFAVTSSASAQRTPSYFPMQLGHNASLYPLSYLLNPGPPRIPTTKRLQGFGAFYFQFLKISRSRAVLELFDKSETPVATAELKLNEEPKAASFVYRISPTNGKDAWIILNTETKKSSVLFHATASTGWHMGVVINFDIEWDRASLIGNPNVRTIRTFSSGKWRSESPRDFAAAHLWSQQPSLLQSRCSVYSNCLLSFLPL